MNKKANLIFKLLFAVLFFVLGYLSYGVVSNVKGIFFSPSEISVGAPSDFIKGDDIEVFPDKVIINIGGAKISSYDSTGSMLPTLNEKSNGIVVIPSDESEINVGDIVSYEKEGFVVVHRVVAKGIDGKGIYFIVKGDNSPATETIRFGDIRYELSGIIY